MSSATSRNLFDVWRSYAAQEESKSDGCIERRKNRPRSRRTLLVELREDLPSGRGLAVTDDVKPYDLVLTIPASMLINVKTIAKVFPRPRELLPSPRSSASPEAARLTSAQALSIFLCCLNTEHEQLRGQSVDVSTELSDLLAFHSSLPTSFATHPVMWCLHSDEGESTLAQPGIDQTDGRLSQGAVYRALLAALPQQTLSIALETTKNLKKDWHRCREIFISQPESLPNFSLPGPSCTSYHSPTLSQFAHAWLCVQTRSVFYPLSLPLHEDNLTLAPLLDMANHTSHADCIATVSVRGAKTQQQLVRAGPGAATSLSPAVEGAGDIEIRAPQPRGLSEGQELCIQYGARNDGRLLAEYGFHLSTSVSDLAQKAPWTGNPHASLSLDMYISAYLDEVRKSERTFWRKETLRDTGYWLDWSVEAFPEASAGWRTEVVCRLLAIEDHDGNSERCAKKTRMDSTAPTQPTHSLEADPEALRRFHLMLSGQIAVVSRENEADSRRLLRRFCKEAEMDLTQRLSRLRESATSTSGGGDDAVAASVDLVTSLLVSQRQIARQMLYRLE